MKLDKYCISDENYYKNTTFISFVITRRCNQTCWYCHWNNETDKTEFVNFDNLLDFIDTQEKSNVHFTFYGGEPTLSEDLMPYMNRLNNKYNNLQMVLITNLSKPYSYLKTLSLIKNLRVVSSYHSDSVENIDSWVRKTKLFDDIHIRLMMTKNNIDDIIYQWKRLKKLGYNVHVKPIEQMNEEHESDYDPETEVVNGQPKHTHFKYMMCSAGFVVRENGDVFKCWEDTTRLLNINDFVYKVEKWGLCLHDDCTCGQRFPKLSIKEYKKCQQKIN